MSQKVSISQEVNNFLFNNAICNDEMEGERMVTKILLPVIKIYDGDPKGVVEIPRPPSVNVDEYFTHVMQSFIDLIPPSAKGNVSDGYHTFNELYDHRILNFILVCKSLAIDEYAPIWKSKFHSDGSSYPGWFIMGINSEPGEQISYHLPDKYWEMTKFAKEYDTAPTFDGHTSADVLVRLEKLINELS